MALKGSGTFAKADPNLTQIAALEISGQGGKVIAVNSGGTAYELVAQTGGVTTFLGLSDTPSAYTGAALQGVRVNAAGNALEFATIATSSGTYDYVTRTIEGVVYETSLMYWRAPAACTIDSISMTLSSNPSATGSYCKVQVMKNGTLETNSIFTADTPMQITETTSATNGIYTASGTLDSNQTTLASGDVIQFRVNQADTGSADLLVQMKVTFT